METAFWCYHEDMVYTWFSIQIADLFSCQYITKTIDTEVLTDSPAPTFLFPVELPAVEDRRLLLIVVDGIRTDESTLTSTSEATGHSGAETFEGVWSRFGVNSRAVRSMLNIDQTDTFPAHVTLFTGRSATQWNMPVDAHHTSLYRPEVPGLFQSVAARCGADRVRFFSNANLLLDASGSLYPGAVSEGFYLPDEENSVTDTALIEDIKAAILEDPCMIVVNLHDVDSSGHTAPLDGYPASIATVDAQLAALWDWMAAEQPDRLRDTLTLLTSDHGRHRTSVDEPAWSEHSGSCGGCREVPLFISGPGVTPGIEDSVPWSQEDVNRLMGAWMGVEQPFSLGLLPDWVTGLGGAGPSGQTGVAVADGHVAAVSWGSDPVSRSAVTVDGEVVSSAAAWAAQDPVIASSGDSVLACWRELLRDEATDRWPWVPVCRLRKGNIWSDLGFPISEIDALPILAAALDGATPVVSWIGNKVLGFDSSVGTARWIDGAWEQIGRNVINYGSSIRLHAANDEWMLSAGGTAVDVYGREDRRAFLLSFNRETRLDAGPLYENASFRIDRTAIRRAMPATDVAALAITDAGTQILLWQMTDNSAAHLPVRLGAETVPLPNISPQWQGTVLYWAALADTVEICALPVDPAEDGSTPPLCTDTGMRWLDSFGVQPDGTVVFSGATLPGQWLLSTL